MIFGIDKFRKSAETVPVVVMEDQEEIAQVIALSLKNLGVKACIVDNGIEGLEKVRELHPKVVLVDIKMPRMSGYEVCSAIQSDPQLSGTHIMVMTALVDNLGVEAEQEWRSRMGVSDFIVKPFNPADLIARVQKLLDLPQ